MSKIIITTMFILAIGIIAVLIIYPVVYILISGEDTIFVKEKWIKYKKSDAKYLIYTDKGTFEISDSLTRWQWRSSDLYGCIENNKSYNIKYYGFRFGFLSDYKNIYYINGCKIL